MLRFCLNRTPILGNFAVRSSIAAATAAVGNNAFKVNNNNTRFALHQNNTIATSAQVFTAARSCGTETKHGDGLVVDQKPTVMTQPTSTPVHEATSKDLVELCGLIDAALNDVKNRENLKLALNKGAAPVNYPQAVALLDTLQKHLPEVRAGESFDIQHPYLRVAKFFFSKCFGTEAYELAVADTLPINRWFKEKLSKEEYSDDCVVWASCSDDKQNFHRILLKRITDFVKVKSQTTITKRFREQGKCFDGVESLGKFFVGTDHHATVSQRYGDTGGFPLVQVSDRAYEYWDSVIDAKNDKALIISGSSGSGKTMLALALSKSHRGMDGKGAERIVFYFVPDPNVFANMHSGSTAFRDNKDLRDEAAIQALETHVTNMVRGNVENLLRDEASPRIVVVIDEIGPFPLLIRAICRQVATVARSLYKTLTQRSGKVLFILAGTGASYAAHDVATTPTSFALLQLDPVAAVDLGKIFESSINHSWLGPDLNSLIDFTADERNMLLRLHPKFVPGSKTFPSSLWNPTPPHRPVLLSPSSSSVPLADIEENARHLMANPRCLTLLVLHMRKTPRPTALDDNEQNRKPLDFPRRSSSWAVSVPAFRATLQGALPAVVESYISMNGLAKNYNPLQVLIAALAVTLYRLPFLPSAQLSAGLIGENPDATMYLGDKLVTSGGILSDLLRLYTSNSPFPTADEFERRVDVTASLPLSVETGSYFYIEKRSGVLARYDVSPAHVAMVRSRLGLTPRDSGSQGLEHKVVDLCALLLAAAPTAAKIVDEINTEAVANKKPNAIVQFHEKCNDPLQQLKNLLRRHGSSASGVDALQLAAHQSALQLMSRCLDIKKNIKKLNDSTEETKINSDADELADELTDLRRRVFELTHQFYSVLRERLEQDVAVVIECPPMESTADVFVVANNFVAPIQCKQKIGHWSVYVVEKQNNDSENVRALGHGNSKSKYVFKEKRNIEWDPELVKMLAIEPQAGISQVMKDQRKRWESDSLAIYNLLTEYDRFRFRSLWISAMLHAADSNTRSTPFLDFFTEMTASASVKWDDKKINAFFDCHFESRFVTDYKNRYATYSAVEVQPFFFVETSDERVCSALHDDFNATLTRLDRVNDREPKRPSCFDPSVKKPLLITIVRPSTNKSGQTDDAHHPAFSASSAFYPIPTSSVASSAQSNLIDITVQHRSALLDKSKPIRIVLGKK